ncbi:hypothetical protein RJ639_046217 [Escallonia herrerae]|uniref:Uncharacterized protein n=1 Tax=Escallonia herrerae TaxID=1293975 RepID=A0AA88W6Q2_9ASTE|nr:hypothetical protein RJ639_046217 [Escallonia herrerae]
MKPIDDKKETVTLRAVSRDEEGRKRVEKVEADTRDLDTLRHIEKKLVDKGVQRLERRPADGIPLNKQPKAGHGGKYTWEGPEREAENELDPAPAALDERDPNYVDEEAEGRVVRGEATEAEGLVVGEVEVAKMAEEGVARVDVADRELLKV